MGLNFAYTQYYNQGLELQALKSVTRNILTADAKTEAINNENERLILDLYNGELDSFVAKQIALSNSGMQIETNKNIRRLAKVIEEKELPKVTMENNNFFTNGSMNEMYASQAMKGEIYPVEERSKDSKYLFINVA